MCRDVRGKMLLDQWLVLILATWPDGVLKIDRCFSITRSMPSRVAEKMVRDNPCAFYGL